MDLIAGPDLAQVIGAGPVALRDAVAWTRQACQAAQHAHQQGVVHCDLKPDNVLLDADGAAQVTDFGLARSVAEAQTCDALEGTAPFMAPEQVSGHWGSLGPRTDVYGLGALLYALLTGRAPYEGATLPDILAQVISAAPIAAPGSLRREIPPVLNAICLRCLAQSPAARYASAADLDAALAEV